MEMSVYEEYRFTDTSAMPKITTHKVYSTVHNAKYEGGSISDEKNK